MYKEKLQDFLIESYLLENINENLLISLTEKSLNLSELNASKILKAVKAPQLQRKIVKSASRLRLNKLIKKLESDIIVASKNPSMTKRTNFLKDKLAKVKSLRKKLIVTTAIAAPALTYGAVTSKKR